MIPPLNVLTFSPPDEGCSEGLDAFRFLFKTNVAPEKDSMASVNQTPGGYKFAPLVANQL